MSGDPLSNDLPPRGPLGRPSCHTVSTPSGCASCGRPRPRRAGTTGGCGECGRYGGGTGTTLQDAPGSGRGGRGSRRLGSSGLGSRHRHADKLSAFGRFTAGRQQATAATADAGAAAGVAAAGVVRPNDPAAPVPVFDDQRRPVLIPEGPNKGQQMLRPAGLAPHLFVREGTADKSYYDALINHATPNPYSGDGTGPAILLREFMQLSKLNQGGEWDAQRVGGQFHPEYVDYATVAIGLYAASSGMSRDEILRIEDAFAARESRYRPETEMDKIYTHLPVRNVANTDLGFQLYQSGGIHAAARP